ncbi:uncharacterized protein DS421_6g184770 [Arachis hypogaea]|nr:uncharacterized protein DS421_6g184770 [Arachis hypogaea]
MRAQGFIDRVVKLKRTSESMYVVEVVAENGDFNTKVFAATVGEEPCDSIVELELL